MRVGKWVNSLATKSATDSLDENEVKSLKMDLEMAQANFRQLIERR